jgi:hypothetical protein
MAYPGVVDDLRTCARLGVPSRVPVFALGEEFDVEMYGVDYGEYIWSPEKMVECQVQTVQRFDYDWILLHPDDYIEFEPLGIETTVSERIPPAAISNPPAGREALSSLKPPDPCRGLYLRLPQLVDDLLGCVPSTAHFTASRWRPGAPDTDITPGPVIGGHYQLGVLALPHRRTPCWRAGTQPGFRPAARHGGAGHHMAANRRRMSSGPHTARSAKSLAVPLTSRAPMGTLPPQHSRAGRTARRPRL